MKITKITQKEIHLINSEIQAALKSVEAKFGISIKTGKSTYTNQNYKVTVEVAIKGPDGQEQTQIVSDFKTYKEMYGIKPNLGDSVFFNGEFYTIAGLRSSSRKFPVVVKNLAGKMFCIPVKETNEGAKVK